MLSLEKLLDVVKEILRYIKHGNKVLMYTDASSANGDSVFIPSSVRSFIITNLGADGLTSSYTSYTLSDGENYSETVSPAELIINRDAGLNSTFLNSFTATPAAGHQLKVVYLK